MPGTPRDRSEAGPSTGFPTRGGALPTVEASCCSLLGGLLDPDCLVALRLESHESVLDVGCGHGEFTGQLLARARTVVAVDRDATALERARARTPGGEFRLGDATELPLHRGEWGTFDVVHARYLLESVREQALVVAQLVRAARPGGRIVIADDDHEALCFWPPCPAVHALWTAYLRAFDAAGNDSIAGRKLIALLAGGGATPVRNRSISFDTCAGEPFFAAAVGRLRQVFLDWREGILATLGGDAPAFDATLAEFAVWSERPDATIWYLLRWAEGRRPSA